MQKNRRVEKYMKERIKRATLALKQIWSIGERLFRNDFIIKTLSEMTFT